MNNRIVVGLQSPMVGPPQLYLLEPSTHPAAGRPLAFDLQQLKELMDLAKQACLPGAPPDVLRMQKFGETLFARLNFHPAIAGTVGPLLHLHPDQLAPFYFYFEHRVHEIECLPLEALFAPDIGFLSQNRDFAMARMFYCNSAKSEWLYEPPLKIAAVLGAGGDEDEKISAQGQWEGLRDMIKGSALPIELKIWTCQIDLRDEINTFVEHNRLADGHAMPVSAELIRDRDQLFLCIREFAPQMLHVFCHGSAQTKPVLQLATFQDWETDAPGSIHIEGEQLKQNADLDGHIWLVTLNCCETARDGPDDSSLSMPVACNLVGSGIPVVIGMRERIDVTFADKFCTLFYRSVIEELHKRLEEAREKGVTNVHWARGLFQVRQSMYQNMVSGHDWTMPVMHTRLKPFQLRVNPAGSAKVNGTTVLPPGPGKQGGVSAQEIHQYGEELLQLHEDRKIYAHLAVVVKRINQRIEEIEKALSA